MRVNANGRWLWLVGVALWLPAAAEAAGFPPSETIFPATTRAWVSATDPHGLQERFDQSPYGRLIADPRMEAFVAGFREQLHKRGSRRLGRLGLTFEDFGGLTGGELAAAAIEAQPGRLAMVLLIDTTGHEAEARTLVETIGTRLLEQKATKVAVPGAPAQLTVYQLSPDPLDERGTETPRDRRVALALAPTALIVGDDALQVGQAFAVLAQGRQDSLASRDDFQAVMAACREQVPANAAPLRWYVDPLNFAKAYQSTNPPREKRKGPDYVAILGRQGFDAVKAAGGVVVFQEGSHTLRHHTMVYAPPLPGRDPASPERFDLAARMLRFPNVDTLAPPAWIPRDVAAWAALQWDVRTAFGSAESLVDDVVGDEGVFDDVIASLKDDPDGPQIDVQKDLVDCLDGRIVTVSDHVEPVSTDSERLVIALGVADEPRVAATIQRVMDADRDMQRFEVGGHAAWEMIDRSHAVPKLEVETPGGAVRHADRDDDSPRRRHRRKEKEEKLLPHSAVTVAHGHLIIASHRDMLERVVTAPGGADALANAADFAAINAELNRYFPGSSAARGFGREDDSIEPSYELLRQGMMPKSKSVFGQVLNGILGDGKPGSVREQRIDGSTLPEFDLVRAYLGTTGTGMESRADGWYVVGLVVPRPQQDQEVARSPSAAVR